MRGHSILLVALLAVLAAAVAVNAVEDTSWGVVKSLLESSPAPVADQTWDQDGPVPAARTVSNSAVSTCDVPGCRPGFSAPGEASLMHFTGEFVPDEGPVGGISTLWRNTGSVSTRINATQLVAGDAITLWWVVFNNPDACVDGCGEDDLGLEAVNAAVIWGAGRVADSDGTATIGTILEEGPPVGRHPSVCQETLTA